MELSQLNHSPSSRGSGPDDDKSESQVVVHIGTASHHAATRMSILVAPPAAVAAAPIPPASRLQRFASTNCIGRIVAHELTKYATGVIGLAGLCVFGVGALTVGPLGAVAISGACVTGFAVTGWVISTGLSASTLGPGVSVRTHVKESAEAGFIGLCLPFACCGGGSC